MPRAQVVKMFKNAEIAARRCKQEIQRTRSKIYGSKIIFLG